MDYVVHKSAGTVREPPKLPGQVVLVFQGGGALGAYQGGVYQALHETGIEPNWVVGTSIGAIAGAIIAGNEVGSRLDRLREFWDRLERKPVWSDSLFSHMGDNAAAYFTTMVNGISGYYSPNPAIAFGGLKAAVGVENAAFYKIDDLRKTVSGVVDF